MTAAADAILVSLSYLLAGLAAWDMGRAWVRDRDRYQADTLIVVGLLVAILLVGRPAATLGLRYITVGIVLNLCFLSQPFFLLRLVHRFRRVPDVLWLGSGIGAIVGASVAVVWPPAEFSLSAAALAIYFIATLSYAAWAFGAEAGRAAGASARRLWFAALGTWLHTAVAVVFGLSLVAAWFRPFEPLVAKLLGVSVFGCYYVGLVGPRRLRTAWARTELYRYLRETTERAPDDRGHHATADLVEAARRGVSCATAAALIFDTSNDCHLRVASATDRAWQDCEVVPTGGLIGRAFQRGSGVIGAAADCEVGLAAVAADLGATVLVTPIATSERRWGALIVVQQRGSLFPEDDLELVEVLSRHAAMTLDHARLLELERERQRQLAQRQVRESDLRFDEILESIRDYAVLLVGGDGRIVDWKAGASAIFGHTASEMVGEHAAELYGQDVESFATELTRATVTGLTRDDVCVRRDGTTFRGITTIRAMPARTTGERRFVVVTRDETERHAVEQRLRESQKMDAVGQLAGGIAHDFNNLLTTTLGYVALIEPQLPKESGLRQDLAEIRIAGERAADLTRRLLAFSRRQVVQPRVIALSDVVRDALQILTPTLGKHVEIHVEACLAMDRMFADPAQIEQIVLNLVLNARDAMPSGGRIVVRVARQTVSNGIARELELAPGVYLTLDVVDRGIGMSPETCSRIFEPFFTTKGAGVGAGLGLSTVYGAVKQMRGGIRVRSAEGRGTTVTVYFQDAPESDQLPAAAAAPVKSLRGSEVILLVEDDASIRRLLTLLLEDHGYTVIVARHPAEAEAASCERDRVDLVITDVLMPGGTGPGLVTKLSTSRPRLRALYISGYAFASLASEGTILPGTNFLQKPFTHDQLLRRVRDILDT